MRLGRDLFHDPFAYYRHTWSDRAMLLAFHEIETGQPVFERAAKKPARPKGMAKKPARGMPETLERPEIQEAHRMLAANRSRREG